ncbi:MAG: glutamate--tRNA ligase family protein [Polyangiaceae bacterium]|nr:glutamate--tRNA ligase family protein [Polyangiaceae bacterium]
MSENFTPPSTPRGRLAPSPTGALHLGHAFSFALAWAEQRFLQGHLILRWEDLDVQRASEKYIQEARDDLQWLGLDWDEERVQSTRQDRIIEEAQHLFFDGRAYPCVCSRKDLQTMGAPHGGEIRYDGRCKGRFLTWRAAQDHGPAALRFRCPDEAVQFEDGFFGPQVFHPAEEVGDFPILRKDGSPAYQLAVVVDDALDGITHITRGADLLGSAARQIQLQRALGFSTIQYRHVPLICNHNGVRLAKRDAALSLRSLREAGVRSETIWQWLAELSLGAELSSLVAKTRLLESYAKIQFSSDKICLPQDPLRYFQQKLS